MAFVYNPHLEHHLDHFDDVSSEEQESSTRASYTEKRVTEEPEKSATIKRDSFSTYQVSAEWIVMGIIASGVVHGFLSVAQVALLLALRLLWKVYWWLIANLTEQDFLHCRAKVSKLLGSVGAPPLFPANKQHASIDAPYKTIWDFCRAHTLLIMEIDQSIDTLRTAVGMHLGTTLQSVERVELSSVRRRGNRTVALTTVRRMLLQVMMNHYKSLQAIADELSKEKKDDDFMLPEVIALAWLKSFRNEVANLVSYNCSMLLSQDVPSALQGRLCDAIIMAKESRQYLSSMCATSASSKPRGSVDNLCRQFDSASVALWACRMSFEDNAENRSNAYEFLKQFENLLHATSESREVLQNDVVSDDDEGVQEDEIPIAARDDKPAYENVGDYEHLGLSFDAKPQSHAVSDDFVDKTVVFSGTGSKQKAVPVNNKSSAGGDESAPAVLPTRSASVQRSILEELEKRLAQMDRVEEVNPDGSHVDESVATTLSRRKASAASPMFLGASGDLLKELKTSMGNEQDVSFS